MEIVLLLAIIVCLILVYNSFNSKLKEVILKLNYLNNLYENLAKGQKQGFSFEDKPIVKEQAIEEQPEPEVAVVPHPIPPTPKPVVEEVLPPVSEVIPPVFVAENVVEEVETVHQLPNLPPYKTSSSRADDYIYTPKPSWLSTFKENNPDLEKFIGENLINKIGVLILVLGISYFVKFAIDKNWISEPARVGIGILVGGLIMFIAHKLRANYKAFSSVLVAGAVAVFYLTIAIAFHDYHLFSQTGAFIIMVVITAFSAFVSVSYNRVELAVLSLIGGFAVPFMVSTGSGNYMVLFTYIAILNVGILTIAYFKRWLLINILAYVFTTCLFLAWFLGVINKGNPPYLPALSFAFLFYLIFALMNMINNIKFNKAFSAIQISVMVSNTFVFYGVGMSVLNQYHPELRGAFTAGLALLNLISAWIIYKKSDYDKNLIYLLIGLALSFITLAVPVQFSKNYITLFWAAEAVLLMWLAIKSKFVNFKLGSIIVHSLMVISLVMDWYGYSGHKDLRIILNPLFVTTVFSVLSLVAVWRLLRDKEDESIFKVNEYRTALAVFAVAIAYIGGFLETYHQAYNYFERTYAPNSIVAVYHFVFSIVLIHFFLKDKTFIYETIAKVISALNILLMVFVFSIFAMEETKMYISYYTKGHLAYLLHFVLLILSGYFIFYLNSTRKNTKINPVFIIWAVAFLIVYLASFELMLHVMFASLNIPSAAEISKVLIDYKNQIPHETALEMVASDKIESLRILVIRTGFPILWAVLVFVFLILGIKNKSKHMRIAALALLGITVIKLFTYDIKNASETGKIVAFILLGVLILIISFVYQKIKKLVVSDEASEINKNDNDL